MLWQRERIQRDIDPRARLQLDYILRLHFLPARVAGYDIVELEKILLHNRFILSVGFGFRFQPRCPMRRGQTGVFAVFVPAGRNRCGEPDNLAKTAPFDGACS